MKKSILFSLSALFILASCGSNKIVIKSTDYQIDDLMPDPVRVMPVPQPVPEKVIGSEPRNVVAKATVFKMSGDYADRVAVTIGPNGDLTYFPAPSDINDTSAPVEIGDGWYLNRQGLGANSVFTKWTFTEYAALTSVPNPREIMDAIIPGAKVTEFRTLPITASEASDMSSRQLLDYIE